MRVLPPTTALHTGVRAASSPPTCESCILPSHLAAAIQEGPALGHAGIKVPRGDGGAAGPALGGLCAEGGISRALGLPGGGKVGPGGLRHYRWGPEKGAVKVATV